MPHHLENEERCDDQKGAQVCHGKYQVAGQDTPGLCEGVAKEKRLHIQSFQIFPSFYLFQKAYRLLCLAERLLFLLYSFFQKA